MSPVAGIFSPISEPPVTVTVGSALGFVRAGADEIPVVSPFAGELIAMVAVEGERLEPYQRVAWLRAA